MAAEDVGLDSLYVRDASVVCDRGAILCSMGKEARRREPEDVANVVRFLCSEDSRHITGQVIVVDGGLSLD